MPPELSWADVLLRLAVAAGLSGLIGLERELRERTAGFRTHILVGLGAALFTIVSAYAWDDFVLGQDGGGTYDPTRIAAQIVTGIGFLGAGAIIRHRHSVKGLTTAAGLWVVAAIGMAAGAGFWSGALIATGLVLLGLVPLRWLERPGLLRGKRDVHLAQVEIKAGQPAAPVLDALERLGAGVSRFEIEDQGDRRTLNIEVEVPSDRAAHALVESLARLDFVVGVDLGR
jgi:putative Mg2+ transporter-C (MgtC) family protein